MSESNPLLARVDIDEEIRRTAERVARESYGKLVAFLSARTRDVAGAEDALSDAFAAALVDWPRSGVPGNPEGWLMTVARRKQIDAARHRHTSEAAAEQLRFLSEMSVNGAAEGEKIPDERLALMFACAHPAIDSGIRAPLMLQAVLGFDAAAIASAFLISPATMGQRLVRAKTKIKQAGIPFRVPDRDELPERLEAVLDAIYAAYAEGWTDPTGTDARRRNLADEAIWLGRLVASLLPDEPESLGLLALMLHSHARRKARPSDEMKRDVNSMSRKALTFRAVRTAAAGLPDVEEGTAYGSPALKVRGKLLACLAVHKSAEPNSLVVCIGFEPRDELIAAEPGIYYLTDHYVDHPSVLVRLARIHPDALRDLLGAAWRFVTARKSKG